jgi:hypothetical protein
VEKLRIGIDLDNTIVCYDDLFVALARRRGLIGNGSRPGRIALRDELRAGGREHIWTELQGEAYGEHMQAAPPFSGALDFVRDCGWRGISVFIVSHRTRQPYRGTSSDLHAAAHRWLERQGFAGPAGVAGERIYLEITREEKMRRIGTLRCTHFIDDLADVLTDPAFPATTVPILFDPHDIATASPLRRLHSWARAMHAIMPDE